MNAAVALGLRIVRRATCNIVLHIRSSTATGKKQVRRYRARKTLSPGRRDLRITIPRTGRAGLPRARGTIRVQITGNCKPTAGPGDMSLHGNAVLIRPRVDSR